MDITNGIRVAVHCAPNARETSILVERDGSITMRVHAPPVKGKANREIVRWLSKKLDRPGSQIRIVSGLHSDLKILQILGTNRESFLAAVQEQEERA
jgi:uncharacterized protein (TIGR00251 family)